MKKVNKLHRLIRSDRVFSAAMQDAGRDALERARVAGLKVSSWTNGQVVWQDPAAILASLRPAKAKPKRPRPRTAKARK